MSSSAYRSQTEICSAVSSRPTCVASRASAANGADATGTTRIVSARLARLVLGGVVLFMLGTATIANAAPSSATSAVSIQNFAFMPASLTVALGDSVTWTNKDAASHTVPFNSGGRSGTLGTGATFTFTFMSAGTFSYHCAIHPSMTATVTVVGASTPAPTPVPTTPPTPAPTAPPPATAPPTAPPATPAPTTTGAASPSATPDASTSGSAATSTASTSPNAVAPAGVSPSASAVALASPAVAAAQDDGHGAILIGGAVLLLAAFIGTAWSLRRR